MKYDRKLSQTWLKSLTGVLPKFDQIVHQLPTNTLVIGACVFDIYNVQGWLPALKRKTGDLDLSVGLINDDANYGVAKTELLNAGYTNDPNIRYRFFPPREIPGALAYIDLLAHPASETVSEATAKAAMGAGPDFSFAAMNFAMTEVFEIEKNLSFPNPLALAALKLRAYHDEPLKRVKDLADVAEMTYGLVGKGMHFEMDDLWGRVKHHDEAKFVRTTLESLGNGGSTTWDLENASQELANRNFSNTEIEEVIPERLLALVENLKI